MTSHSSWNSLHRRDAVLRTVLEHLDAQRDGALPMDLPGVREAFGDPVGLVAALQMRWHTRLSGTVERSLMAQPTNLEAAVLDGWRATARSLPGVRLVLDRQAEQPASQDVADLLERAVRKDRALLAVMAGRAAINDHGAAAAGRSIERRARAAYDPTVPPRRVQADPPANGLVERLKAALTG